MTEAAEFQDTLQKYDTLTGFMSSQKKKKNFFHITLTASGSVGLLITDLCYSIMDVNVHGLTLICHQGDGERWSLSQEPGMPWVTGQRVTQADTLQEAMSLLQ